MSGRDSGRQGGGNGRQGGGRSRDAQSGGRGDRTVKQPQQGGPGQGGPGGPGGMGGAYGHGPGGEAPWKRHLKFGVGAYLTAAVGTVVTVFLFLAFSSGATTTTGSFGGVAGSGGGGNDLFAAVSVAFLFVLFLAGIVATGLGVYVGRTHEGPQSTAAVSAGVNAAGVLTALLVLFVLLIATAPGGGGGADRLLGPLFGATIGVALTGAAAGAVGERLRVE